MGTVKNNYCTDIMDWRQFPPHDAVWCDPPWENSALRMFQTMMRKKVGHAPDRDIDEILNHLGKLCDPQKLLVIEYAQKSVKRVKHVMSRYGHQFKKEYTHLYGKRPYSILVFNRDISVATDEKEGNCITETLKPLEDIETVFDPFAGIGVTAKAVRKAGKKYSGAEVNPDRFRKLCVANP